MKIVNGLKNAPLTKEDVVGDFMRKCKLHNGIQRKYKD